MNEKTLYSFTLRSKAGLVALTILAFIPPFWFLIPYCLNSATEFLVTNRRVRLKKFCGQWTEIPMDNICAISRSYWYSKVAIRSASGAIVIWGASDRDKIFEIISMNICVRQSENAKAPSYELPVL